MTWKEDEGGARAVSMHLSRSAKESGQLADVNTHTHTHTRARAHTHTHTHTRCNRKHNGRVSQRCRFESRRGQWALFSLILSALSFVFL